MKKLQKSVVWYAYTKHGSKNHIGGMRHFHLSNEVMYQYLDVGCRDHVYTLDKYFDKFLGSAKVDGYFIYDP